MIVEMTPIGYVESTRKNPVDDYWGGEEAIIRLSDQFEPSSLRGLEAFSHAEIVYFFHRVHASKIVPGARHPRDNTRWPSVGIFAQRGKNRPNRIGTTICRVLRIEALCLHVAELDAIDGTPVLDIKPVMQEFLPRQAVRQPEWSNELMKEYWAKNTP